MRLLFIVAALLLLVPRIKDAMMADSIYFATHRLSEPSDQKIINTGPHAVVLSNGERFLLLRPGESGVWSGAAEISTPDGYEKEDIK